MSIYWVSPYTSNKHIIGSTPYFLEGLDHIRSSNGDRVYNPYKRDYVSRDGPAYETYRLGDLYSMAEKVSFELSDSCSRVYVKYPIGIAKKMDTLAFVKYLQSHDNKYRIYTFEKTFYEKIAACIDDKTSKKANEMRDYLVNLKTMTLNFKINAAECSRKLRDHKICTKEDLERFRSDPDLYRDVEACLEYILVKGVDIGCREPSPMFKPRRVPEDVAEPTPVTLYKGRGTDWRKMRDDIRKSPVRHHSPSPIEIVTPEPEVVDKVHSLIDYNVPTAETPLVMVPFPPIPSALSYDGPPSPVPARPSEMRLDPRDDIKTPLPLRNIRRREPETLEEIKTPNPLPLRETIKREKRDTIKREIEHVEPIEEEVLEMPMPEDPDEIEMPEPVEEMPNYEVVIPVQDRQACSANEVNVPDSCDNYETLYRQMRSKLAVFSNPGCRKNAKTKQKSLNTWYQGCKPNAIQDMLEQQVDVSPLQDMLEQQVDVCPSNDIQIPTTCDNWEDFYERNKLAFDPAANPGCVDESNRKDLALNEWRNACRAAKKNPLPNVAASSGSSDLLRAALMKRRQAMEESQ